MATQEQLHEAYNAFRIPIGSAWEVIKKRYKVLVRIWHPDRQGESLHADAEQELKELNHFYQDIFRPHFEGNEHREDRYCLCQSVPSSQSRTNVDSNDEAPQADATSSPENNPGPKPESEPASGPSPEPEIHTTFTWHNQPVVDDSKVVVEKQRDAGLACGVIFVGMCMFSVFANVSKASFAKTNLDPIAPSSMSITNLSKPREVTYTTPNRLTFEISGDARRAITYNEIKIDAIKREIETRKAQIRMATPSSAGQLYRELGVKEEELRQLQTRTEQLKLGK